MSGEEGYALFSVLEAQPAVQHDDGSGFAVIAGPSAEPRTNPCGVSERAFGMRVLLSFGFAFELGAEGLEQRYVLRLEGVGHRPHRLRVLRAVARMNELLHGDGHDQRSGHQLAARRVLADAQALDVEALRFQGSEQLLDGPAASVEVRRFERLCGA